MNRILIIYPIEKKYGTFVDIDGNIIDKIELPLVFSLPVRIDIIRRAVHSAITARIQPKSRDLLAGKRRVGESWGIGYSVARVPRLDNGRAVLAPNVRGGRRQFAPLPIKKIYEDINWKEMKLAIASSLAALANPYFVFQRNYVIPRNIENLPIVTVNDIENMSSTKELKKFLMKLGLWENIEKTQKSIRIRAGKGKTRGRRYVESKSLLFIVSNSSSPVTKAVRNLPGVDYVTPTNLNILKLAPGGLPGRLCILTTRSLEIIARLFPVEKP